MDQLFINPEDADIAKKDFIFRVSTATMDIEEYLVLGGVLVIDHGTMANKYVLSNVDDQFCDLVITMARIDHLEK